eukprot:2092685-Heterocapsa_arctica.AAC.1
MYLESRTIAVWRSGRATQAAKSSRIKCEALAEPKTPEGSSASPAHSSAVYGVSALPVFRCPAPGVFRT